MTRTHVSFSDLRTAAYCLRKLYYQRTNDEDLEPPPEVDQIRGLERRYEELLASAPGTLEAEPIELSPVEYRETLAATKRRLTDAGHWERLRNPDGRDVFLTGRDCRGIVHKVLVDPLEPVLLSPGEPPPQGVWDAQTVHAVAAAKALAWEHETPIERAWLEYPAYGEIRSLEVTVRRTSRYRRVLRTVRELDGPPPRTTNQSKCEHCEFAGECGVRTRTLRSLLGFGSGD